MVGRVKTILKRVEEANTTTYAAALAFSFIFALFPLMLFLTALLGLLHLPSPNTYLSGPFRVFVAPAVQNLIMSILQDVRHVHSPTLLSIGAIGFVWAMTGALRQLSSGLNQAYPSQHPTQKSWKVLLVSGGLSLLLGILLVASLALGTVGKEIITWLTYALMKQTPDPILIGAIRWILFFALVWISLTLIYNWLPNRTGRFLWMSPGTALVILLWVLISQGFTLYAAHFEHYNKFYGSLGGVILLMLYLYILSFALLLGGEINALWVKGE